MIRKRIEIRVDPELYESLRKEAYETHISMASIIKNAIRERKQK